MTDWPTHTGLILRWDKEEKCVSLNGDRMKLLYPLGNEVYDPAKAKEVFEATKSHFEERAKTEVSV